MTLNLERLLENAVWLQSIPAPTFHEGKRAAAIEKLFRDIPCLDVSQDQTGNVLARIAGAPGQPLIISAHLDTVFPLETSLEHRIQGDRILGPGIGDNALALATLVELGHIIEPGHFSSDLWLIANTAEEGLGNLAGMRAIVDRFRDLPRAYLVLEGMALGHIYHRALPVRRFRISVHGKGGHAWVHAGRRSALHLLLQIGASITKIRLPKYPRTSLNIGLIKGGSSINSIAGLAELEIDLRSEDAETLDKIELGIRRCCNIKRLPEPIEIGIERIGSRPGGAIDSDHPLVQAAIGATRKSCRIEPELGIASTDASLPLSLGLPAICVGITLGGHAHSLDEFIDIGPIPNGFSALRELIDNLMRDAGSFD